MVFNRYQWFSRLRFGNTRNQPEMKQCHNFPPTIIMQPNFSSTKTTTKTRSGCYHRNSDGLAIFCGLFVLFVLLSTLPTSVSSISSENGISHLMGPVFMDEPPSRTHFSNTTGAVITCSATSSIPPVKVWWVLAGDGQIVTDVGGLRYVRPNGQLVFPPFQMNQYRQDIHSTTYRCLASNSFGTIRSRDCQVRAVVHETYKMQVYDEFVIRENVAIMRCHVPSIDREYVRFVAWLRDDQVLVTSTHNPHSGRYSILSTGELLIRNASFSDSGSYRCQTRHQLTDQLRTSEEAGKLIVTEPHNGVAPKIFTHTSVRCEQNSICKLTCVAQSWPLSSYRWYRKSDSGVYMAANLYNNVEIQESNTLIFRPTNAASHDGLWVCVANNSIAEVKEEIRVQVLSPLHVSIEPKLSQVDAGRPNTFNCTSTGGPVIKPPQWYRNGKPLELSREHLHDQKVRLIERNILHIASVHREDIGVYQCIVQSEYEEAQASAELKLGDVAPLLLESFQDKQIVEGGSSISLRCVAVGSPLPQIRWYLDDQPIPNLTRFRIGDHVTNDGKVVSFANITNIRVIDGGEYSCVAANEVGKATFNGRVLVTGGPNVRASFWGYHNLSVVAGQDAIVRCPVIAYPIESVVWEHSGNVLPTNHRQSISSIVDGYGGILYIKDVHAIQDSGEYVCTVRVSNSEIRPVRGNVQMNVHFAPKIDRHTLPSQLSAKQGDRIKLMCSVIEGDQPIEIEWLRNNQIMKSSDQISIQNGEDYSLLTFKSVLISDSDKWTCQTRNNYASDNCSIDIVVNVPPKWIFEPKNAQVILSKSITINCQAEGFPKPKIVWKKAIANSITNDIALDDKLVNLQPTEYRDISSSYRYQVFSNGSLYLQETEINDGGFYMCQISNGIGTDLSKVIQIQIQQPPRAETKFASESVVRGLTATIQCRAEGDSVLRVEWNRDMQRIDSSQNQRYIIKEEATRGSITSFLEILDARRMDSALFTCIISNDYGSDRTDIQLIVEEVPEPPRDISVTEISSRTAKIRWSPSFTGNSAIIGFIVEYKAKCFNKNVINKRNLGTAYVDSPLNWKEVMVDDHNARSMVLRDLFPWCNYEIRMKAKNSIGISETSQTYSFKTAEEMPGGPPQDVSVEPMSSNSLKIKWKSPDKHLQFGHIKGYYIGYRVVDGNRFNAESGEQFAYKNVEANGADTSSFEVAYLTNLKKHTVYSVVVQAFNSIGAGPRSDEITVRTLSIQQQSTLVVEVVTTDSNSITLHWEVDGDTSDQDSEFVLHISEEGSGQWIERRLSSHLRRHIESGLKCGTKYLIYMTHKNKSNTSEIITTRTKGTVAISPSAEEFLNSNSTTIVLNFNSWHNGGCPIRNFSIKYHQNNQKLWKVIGPIKYDIHEPFYITNLEPNRDFVLLVTASSTAGMTEAIYNVSTRNASAMVVRLTHPDISSSEYSSNAPFTNVTILLPIVISVLVLIAVLSTLFAFMRKQDILHEQRDCISNSAQNLRLRSSFVQSKEDITDTHSFPMTDYHSLCQNTNSKSKLCEANHSGQIRNSGESIYGKSLLSTSTMLYSSPKRAIMLDNGINGMAEMLQTQQRPPTRVTVNSHHIYAEPNPSMQQYSQPRCLVANIPSTVEDSTLVNVVDLNNVPPNDAFCALINSNTRL